LGADGAATVSLRGERYEIWNMPGRKFFFGCATLAVVGAGFGIPFAAVEFTQWKTKTG